MTDCSSADDDDDYDTCLQTLATSTISAGFSWELLNDDTFEGMEDVLAVFSFHLEAGDNKTFYYESAVLGTAEDRQVSQLACLSIRGPFTHLLTVSPFSAPFFYHHQQFFC